MRRSSYICSFRGNVLKKIIVQRTIKILILLTVFAVLFSVVQNILRHKCLYRLDETPETEMWEQLYDLPKDTLDIVFVGSSHVYNGVDPVEFYKKTGLKGFDLATSNQDFFTAYYLLKELFKTQSPKCVVIETYAFHQRPFFDRDYDKNTYYKMSFDDMKLSFNKVSAVKEWHKNNSDINVMERLFPVFEYHSRWDELNKADFSDTALRSAEFGFAYAASGDELISYNGYSEAGTLTECPDLSVEYFDKIVMLCREHGAEPVLFTAPDSVLDAGKRIAIGVIADERGITFIDYNEPSKIESIGLGADCWRDRSHMDLKGAVLLTDAIARDLSEAGVIEEKALDNDRLYLEAGKRIERDTLNRTIPTITDFSTYLDVLGNSEDYGVIIAAQGEAFGGLDDALKEKLSAFVPGVDLNDCYGRSFIAVKGLGENEGLMDLGVLSLEGDFDDRTHYKIESVGSFAGSDLELGSYVTIKLNGVDYAENTDGLNFAVYDKTTGEVIDANAFATYAEGAPVIRLRY